METNGTKSAPTGCFKCGRPGHWSRDCPSDPSSNDPSSSLPSNSNPNGFQKAATTDAAATKLVKKRVPRPKLTPELLLSDDGLGYVLRYFPRSFKYRGRGREVSDLGNLIRLYSEWHSHLLPSYSFDQFVHKTEQIAATKRVKICIKELRERVARGGDPSKLHEDPIEQNDDQDLNRDKSMASESIANTDMESEDMMNTANDVDDDAFQEVMLNEIFETAINEPHRDAAQQENIGGTDVNLTEEQRARMEANKLKALEKSKDSSSRQQEASQTITEEQKARMEANRLKALERAAARASKTPQSA